RFRRRRGFHAGTRHGGTHRIEDDAANREIWQSALCSGSGRERHDSAGEHEDERDADDETHVGLLRTPQGPFAASLRCGEGQINETESQFQRDTISDQFGRSSAGKAARSYFEPGTLNATSSEFGPEPVATTRYCVPRYM